MLFAHYKKAGAESWKQGTLAKVNRRKRAPVHRRYHRSEREGNRWYDQEHRRYWYLPVHQVGSSVRVWGRRARCRKPSPGPVLFWQALGRWSFPCPKEASCSLVWSCRRLSHARAQYPSVITRALPQPVSRVFFIFRCLLCFFLSFLSLAEWVSVISPWMVSSFLPSKADDKGESVLTKNSPIKAR